MTVLWISLAVVAALAFVIWLAVRMGRFIAGPQKVQEPRPPTEEVPGDKWVQDYIHRLGRDVEERSPRFKNWRPS